MGKYIKNKCLNMKLYRGVLYSKTFDDKYLIKNVKVINNDILVDYSDHIWLNGVNELRAVKNGCMIEFLASEYDYQSRKRFDPMRSKSWSKVGLDKVRRVRVI
jgi:hypothetical protein